jgi:hypothetical protein
MCHVKVYKASLNSREKGEAIRASKEKNQEPKEKNALEPLLSNCMLSSFLIQFK